MKHKLTKRISIWAVVVAGILLIPFITNAPWTSFDYVFAGIVLFILSIIYEFTTINMKNVKNKLIVGAVILMVIILIMGWAATGSD
jgi:CDP-diglyceride synthetase